MVLQMKQIKPSFSTKLKQQPEVDGRSLSEVPTLTNSKKESSYFPNKTSLGEHLEQAGFLKKEQVGF